MKTLLKLIFVITIILIGLGIYFNSGMEGEGEKFIGFGVLIFAFIFMPLFIYHRYHGKDLSRYSIDKMLKNLKDERNDKKNK